jgi:hypothetical protein
LLESRPTQRDQPCTSTPVSGAGDEAPATAPEYSLWESEQPTTQVAATDPRPTSTQVVARPDAKSAPGVLCNPCENTGQSWTDSMSVTPGVGKEFTVNVGSDADVPLKGAPPQSAPADQGRQGATAKDPQQVHMARAVNSLAPDGRYRPVAGSTPCDLRGYSEWSKVDSGGSRQAGAPELGAQYDSS